MLLGDGTRLREELGRWYYQMDTCIVWHFAFTRPRPGTDDAATGPSLKLVEAREPRLWAGVREAFPTACVLARLLVTQGRVLGIPRDTARYLTGGMME